MGNKAGVSDVRIELAGSDVVMLRLQWKRLMLSLVVIDAARLAWEESC